MTALPAVRPASPPGMTSQVPAIMSTIQRAEVTDGVRGGKGARRRVGSRLAASLLAAEELDETRASVQYLSVVLLSLHKAFGAYSAYAAYLAYAAYSAYAQLLRRTPRRKPRASQRLGHDKALTASFTDTATGFF